MHHDKGVGTTRFFTHGHCQTAMCCDLDIDRAQCDSDALAVQQIHDWRAHLPVVRVGQGKAARVMSQNIKRQHGEIFGSLLSSGANSPYHARSQHGNSPRTAISRGPLVTKASQVGECAVACERDMSIITAVSVRIPML